MKTVENISLAGLVFALEEDAAKALMHYITRNKKAIETDEDREEIIADLERSIAAQLKAQNYDRDKAVSLQAMTAILTAIGNVDGAEKGEAKHSQMPEWLHEPFYLSETNKVIFGLCGAIAERVGIDAIWIRLAVVVLGFLSHGVVFGLYVVVSIALLSLESSPRSKKILATLRNQAKKEEGQESLRTTTNQAKSIVEKVASIIGAIICIGILAAVVGIGTVYVVAMLQSPALDLPVLGFNRSPTAYVLVGSTLALAALICCGSVRELGARTSRTERKTSLWISLVGWAIGMTLIVAVASSAYFLRSDIQATFQRDPQIFQPIKNVLKHPLD